MCAVSWRARRRKSLRRHFVVDFFVAVGRAKTRQRVRKSDQMCEFFSPLGNFSKSQQRALLGPVGWEPRGFAHQPLGAELVRLAPVDDSGGDVGR